MIRVTLKAKRVQSLVMGGFLSGARWGIARGLASEFLVTNDTCYDINRERPVGFENTGKYSMALTSSHDLPNPEFKERQQTIVHDKS